MVLKDGIYQIVNTGPGNLLAGTTPGILPVGAPLMAAPDDTPLNVLFDVRRGRDDDYRFYLVDHTGLIVGYNERDRTGTSARVRVKETRDAAAWAVEHVDGEDRFRIHIYRTDKYWTVSSSGEDGTTVVLQKLDDGANQTWKFMRMD